MNFTYTPPLMEQIRHQHEVRKSTNSRIVTVRVAGRHWIERIDPETHQATGDPQQFVMEPDGTTLTILPMWEWVADPEIYDVERFNE